MFSTFRDDYLSLFKKLIKVIDMEDFHEITLPFFDRIGDQLSVYVESKGDSLRVTDDGYIYDNLIDFGYKSSKKRDEIIDSICRQYGITFEDGELWVAAKKSNLPSQVHNLAMGMLRIDDMDLLKTTRVASVFCEDVKKVFDDHELNYTENFMFRGKSGFSQNFDFFFQKNRSRKKDLVCKLINTPNKSNMESAIFSWEDVADERGENTQCIVIMNDTSNINEDIINGFKQYHMTPLGFSNLEKEICLFS